MFENAEKILALKDGLSLSILGISVVFIGLIILFAFMKIFILISTYNTIKNEQNEKKTLARESKKNDSISGEIITAISLAIRMSREEFHDMEEAIITLNKIAKPYSPWSSKIHGLRRPVR